MGSNNSIIGDAQGIDLPQMEQDDKFLVEEKKMAKYSRSAEFKKIKEHFEAKTAYYQQFLPGNVPPEMVPEEERAKYWAIANILIKEFQEVINMYENASEAVKDAK